MMPRDLRRREPQKPRRVVVQYVALLARVQKRGRFERSHPRVDEAGAHHPVEAEHEPVPVSIIDQLAQKAIEGGARLNVDGLLRSTNTCGW